jgi:glycosyltransferase involved in cell wall biosynthesis
LSRKLKIAQVTTSDMALRFLLLDQLHLLRSMGHEVVCVCSPGPWVSELRDRGFCVETIPMRRTPAASDLLTLRALYRAFKAHRFDIVHTHTPKAGLLGPVAARMAHVSVVMHTAHGLLFHDRMSAAAQALYWLPEKLTAACSHKLLLQSREDVKRAISTRLCPSGRITWIGNGIDVARFSRASARGVARRELGLGDADFVVGCVGRLVRGKGLEELLSAAQRVAESCSDIKFLLIGLNEQDHPQGVPTAMFEPLIRAGKLVFAGTRTDMPLCYAAMDVLVHPSRREGVPRVCLEAAAMQLPVIASDIRGCREAVVHGETGLLVPVRDSLALAEAIETMRQNPGLRRAMGAAGRRHVTASFDARMVLNRVEEVYRGISEQIGGKAFAAAAR